MKEEIDQGVTTGSINTPRGLLQAGMLRRDQGRHEEALRDYRMAIEIEPDIVKGPGFLWRFMRNISEKPPSIQQRADYIEEELKKPPAERKLSLPEMDDEQRMYKR